MATLVRDRVLGDPDHDHTPQRPPSVSGLLVGAVVFGVGMVLCIGCAMIVWLTSDAGSAGTAVRVGAGMWLAGNGGTVGVGAATVTVVPLGLTLLVGFAAAVSARRLGTPEGIVWLSVAAGLGYAVAMAVTAIVASSPAVSFSPVRSALIGGAVVAAGAVLGASTVDGWLRELWRRAPETVRGAVTGAGAALAVVVLAGFGLVGYALIADVGELRRTFGALDPGFIGGTALLLLCVLALPNAALYAVAVLLGPGFAVGEQTSVTLLSVRLGDVPAVPLLAALPDPGTQPAWVSVLAVVPVIAGGVGGYIAIRRCEVYSWVDSLARGCLAGGCAGLLLGLLMLCSGGSGGPGRMAEIGPMVWCVPVAVIALAVGGAMGSAVAHYREVRLNP